MAPSGSKSSHRQPVYPISTPFAAGHFKTKLSDELAESFLKTAHPRRLPDPSVAKDIILSSTLTPRPVSTAPTPCTGKRHDFLHPLHHCPARSCGTYLSCHLFFERCFNTISGFSAAKLDTRQLHDPGLLPPPLNPGRARCQWQITGRYATGQSWLAGKRN